MSNPDVTITVEGSTPVQIITEQNTVIIEVSGATGPPGLSGLTQAVADTLYRDINSYVHVQAIASTLWVINHNLATFPAVTVTDPAGVEVEADVSYINNNTIHVATSLPSSGFAYLT